jgi:hypothetical protein
VGSSGLLSSNSCHTITPLILQDSSCSLPSPLPFPSSAVRPHKRYWPRRRPLHVSHSTSRYFSLLFLRHTKPGGICSVVTRPLLDQVYIESSQVPATPALSSCMANLLSTRGWSLRALSTRKALVLGRRRKRATPNAPHDASLWSSSSNLSFKGRSMTLATSRSALAKHQEYVSETSGGGGDK